MFTHMILMKEEVHASFDDYPFSPPFLIYHVDMFLLIII